MSRSSSTSSFDLGPNEWTPRARFPKAALSFVLAVVAIETLFWFFTDSLTGIPLLQPVVDDAVVSAKHQMATRAGGAVVFVGDSSCGMGVIPAEVTKASGKPIINLGTLASLNMAGFGSMADTAMQPDPPPAAIVIVVLPHALHMTEEQAREDGLLGRYLLAYGLQSDNYQPSFNDWRRWILAKHRFNKFPPQLGGDFDTFSRRLEETRGWLPEEGHYVGTKRQRSNFEPGAMTCDALHNLVLRAEQRKVPILFWWAPSPDDAYDHDYRKLAHAKLLAIQANAPWLHVVQSEPPSWMAQKFATVTHLTPEGAVDHSRILGQVIKDWLNKQQPRNIRSEHK